jgi:4,5-dihydroxyphthalate decarboxylase
MTLSLTFACGVYDRTVPLQAGTVRPEGINLQFVDLEPGELFRRQARNAEFDVSEFALATYTLLTGRGDSPFIGIPVFPVRKFRHGDIYVRTDSGIREPKDLEGRRVGGMGYQQSASVWIRGILQNEYGVDLRTIHWYFGDLNETEHHDERMPIDIPDWVQNTRLRQGQCLNQMLLDGEIDAYLGAATPQAIFDGSPRVRRLFENKQEVEVAYYRRTGVFPIMHVVVIKREVYDAHPWVATSLMRAFAEAKDVADQRLHRGGTLFCQLPWLSMHLEERDRLLGRNPFVDGLEPNRVALETFITYELQQGLIQHSFPPEALFAPETVGAAASAAVAT